LRNSVTRPNKIWTGLFGFLSLAFLKSSSVSSQAQWKGTVAKEGGVTVVRNPKEPVLEFKRIEREYDPVAVTAAGREAADGYQLVKRYAVAWKIR